MNEATPVNAAPLAPGKFSDPNLTATGEARASVDLVALETLWLNTGTLCNLACRNCYIESSPTNDRLSYLTLAEAVSFLDEIAIEGLGTREIGLTGGEPFMNPDITAILETALDRGFDVLVLTNAMTPLHHRRDDLLALRGRFGGRLTIRVSLDHHARTQHEAERGADTWDQTIEGLLWLAENGFRVHVAGRTFAGEDERTMREGYARLFAQLGLGLDAFDPSILILFPEMDARIDVPEITTACWDILGVRPEDQMCARSRMVVKRKGDSRPVVVPCTLLPYDPAFDMGETLAGSLHPVKLNHPHCARFCVLGGGSCSN